MIELQEREGLFSLHNIYILHSVELESLERILHEVLQLICNCRCFRVWHGYPLLYWDMLSFVIMNLILKTFKKPTSHSQQI